MRIGFASVYIVACHSKTLTQASPLYTPDLETATAVLAYDYCHMSWLVAAGFGGGCRALPWHPCRRATQLCSIRAECMLSQQAPACRTSLDLCLSGSVGPDLGSPHVSTAYSLERHASMHEALLLAGGSHDGLDPDLMFQAGYQHLLGTAW